MADVFDLDEVRAAYIAENPMEYRTLKLYGRDWRVRMNPNVAVLLSFADGGGAKGQLDFILGYIHADEREAFREALESDEFFDESLLGRLIDWFTKASTGNGSPDSAPSESPSSPTGPSLTATSSEPAPLASTPSV